MKIEKFICDKDGCKQERATDTDFKIYLESTRDASGNGSDHWYACFDLCSKHLAELSQQIFGCLFDSPKKELGTAKKFLDNNNIKYERL